MRASLTVDPSFFSLLDAFPHCLTNLFIDKIILVHPHLLRSHSFGQKQQQSYLSETKIASNRSSKFLVLSEMENSFLPKLKENKSDTKDSTNKSHV